MPDVLALIRRIGVMPNDVRGTRIECPHVVRSAHVQNAVEKDWRGLNFRGLPGLERPSQRELINVRGSNLRQLAVVLAGISAVIHRPAIGGWLQESGSVERPIRGMNL